MKQSKRDYRSTVRILSGVAMLVMTSVVLSAQTISFDTSPETSIGLGEVYEYRPTATASNGATVRYSLRFGPSGLSVDERTGVVRWTPTVVETYDIEIRAELVSDPSTFATQTWAVGVIRQIDHPGCIGSSSWLSPGDGVPGPAGAAVATEDHLWVLHRDNPTDPVETVLSRWNGTVWQTAARIPDAAPQVTDSVFWMPMVEFRGEVHIGGSWSLDQTHGSTLVRFDESDLVAVEAPFIRIDDLVVFGEELYASGWGSLDGGSSGWKVAAWDGTDWKVVEPETRPNLGTAEIDIVWSLAVVDGRLFAAGRYRLGKDYTIAEIDGHVLRPLVEGNAAGNRIIEHNGELLIYDIYRRSLRRFDGNNSLEPMPTPPSGPGTGGARTYYSHNGVLYGTVGSFINEPVITRREEQVWYLKGSDWVPVSNLRGPSNFGLVPEFASFENRLFIVGHFEESCSTPLANVAFLCLQDDGTCGRLSGSVIVDVDRDCVVDPNETGDAGQVVEISPGDYHAITDESGAYSVVLPTGIYTAELREKRNWIETCENPRSVEIANTSSVVSGVDFTTDMIPGVRDISVSVANTPIRNGRSVGYAVRFTNVGTVPAVGLGRFYFDTEFALEETSKEPVRALDGMLEWEIRDLPVGKEETILVRLLAPTSLEGGAEVCTSTEFEWEKDYIDAFARDDRDSSCDVVVRSYDPNDITVAPHNPHGEVDYATLYEQDTILSYTVRFQNTGNDTAFVVVVRDTLDPTLLEFASIELGAATHPYTFTFDGNGLVWTFDNILLPDSTTDEAGSHGFFKYRIHLKKNLGPNVEIPNRAAIYFDYNDPVITNRVVSVTSDVLTVGREGAFTGTAAVFPNPIVGAARLLIDALDPVDLRITIVDASGTVRAAVHHGRLGRGEHRIDLPVESLESGTYFVTVDRGDSHKVVPIVIAR